MVASHVRGAGATGVILVNTEAFQIIDDADVASDLQIRFGSTAGKAITFERGSSRFNLNDDVYVTGGLEAQGTLSGKSLNVTGSGSAGAPIIFSDVGNGRIGIGTDSPKATLNVMGTMSGRRLNLTSRVPTQTGALYVNQKANATGATIRSKSTLNTPVLVLDSMSNSATAPHLLFGQNKLFDTNLFREAAHTLATGGNFHIMGTLSGATVGGFGLVDCAGTSDKLLWSASTHTFSCGTDESGGTSGGSGISYPAAEGAFVNQGGDTMTGALTIDLAGTNGTGLVIRERAYFGSGATVSGSLMLDSRNDPPAPPEGFLKIYAKTVSGRQLLKAKGPSGLDYPLQPSFFQNQICMLSAGASTTINSVGCSATNDTTLSTPTVNETYGFMTNFATAATALDNAGTSSNVVSFFRGSTSGANGFFYYARVGVVDTTDVRLFSGMANQTIGTMTDSDNPTGHHVGFQFSSARPDTNWKIETKDGSTQNVVDTGMALSTSTVYDTYLFCSPQCTTMYWRIDNITAGTSAEGSLASNLPGGSTALRGVIGVGAVTTVAKNFRFQRMYIESDR
ncbi:MAG TPA: hypothetical protein PKV72_03460 [Candidatus Peribacteria bacterium]|nr:hypothetical protein [Candidatus Peribacteria bacterium]